MAKVLAKTSNNIYWLRFPKPGQTCFSTSEFDLTGKKVIDIAWLNNKFYEGWKNNDHHIMTKCFYKMILPFISLYIKSFSFNIDDFEIVEHFVEKEKYDVKYLIPKNENLRFTLEINGEKVVENGYFDDLHCIGKDYKDFTDYHKVFIGTHSCCILRNETIDNNKTIFITGDSMIIPAIPIFACYYKEVVFMDNRTNQSFKHYYEGKVFDEVIVQLWEGHPLLKPLGINLK